MEKFSGVYAIIHPSSGRSYIGSSKDIIGRWAGRQKQLKYGAHHSPYLQSVWNKYGTDAFHFITLENCDPDERIAREQFLIDQTQASNKEFGFNMSPMARSGFVSPLCREKVVAAQKLRRGIPWKASDPEAWKARISAARTGKTYGPRNPEIGQRISTSLIGKPHSENRKKNISNSIMALSQEARSARAFKAWETKRAKMEVL